MFSAIKKLFTKKSPIQPVEVKPDSTKKSRASGTKSKRVVHKTD